MARPAQVVCGFVAAVVLVDLLTGAHLQLSSVAGYSPLVAGRFAGIGNVAFGVLAAAVLLAASASRRAVVIAAVGLVAVAVDGAPPLGSDVGGVLALVPAFVLLAMLRTGTRVTLSRLALAGAGAAAVVTAFALADFEIVAPNVGGFIISIADEGTLEFQGHLQPGLTGQATRRGATSCRPRRDRAPRGSAATVPTPDCLHC